MSSRAGEAAGLRLLRSAVAAGRWGRPFLLAGTGADVRDGAADAIAAALLCGRREEGVGVACGACGACGRVRRGLHADLHHLEPASGRASIGVDAVDALLERLALRPVEGGARVVVIRSAERLTDQAQNALLKTLEEPPRDTAILLTVASPRALLATVLSRCALVRFPPPGDADGPAAALAAGDAAAAAALVAAASGGEPVEEMAEEGIPAGIRALARGLAPGGGGDVAEAAAWLVGKGGDLEGRRRRLRALLRAALVLHGRAAAGDAAARGALEGHGDVPGAALAARLPALARAREAVERNVDPVGILEALAAEVVAR